jgi:hypothetical protein
MKKKTLLALILGNIFPFGVLTMRNAWSKLKVGDAAPKFMLATTLDKPVSYGTERLQIPESDSL